MKIIRQQYYMNFRNFITALHLLLKLLSEMYFLFHVEAFDDIVYLI